MSRYKLTALPGTLWPNPLDEWASELEIRLRHDRRTTKSDALMAAGMIAAYRELVRDQPSARFSQGSSSSQSSTHASGLIPFVDASGSWPSFSKSQSRKAWR